MANGSVPGGRSLQGGPSLRLGQALMVVDQLTAEAGNELTQFPHLEPGLAPEFLAMVNSKDEAAE